MKKIMYIQHVAWSWIKQRPQFIAEELSQFYEVDVFFKKSYIKKIDNHTDKVKLIGTPALPFSRFPFIQKINDWIMVKHLRRKINRYDIIWICDPRTYMVIKNYIGEGRAIVFDCMDDLAEFPRIKNNQSALSSYLKAEKQLINDSKIVFASSNFLSETLRLRHGDIYDNKICIINNAISTEKSGELIKINDKENGEITKSNENKKIITYIGTISSWFDYKVIKKSLEIHDDIVYYLYGPKDVDLPKHNRLIYNGILQHDQIFAVMNQSDMLVLPFKLTKLVMSVDPVKLYEYIYSRKPILAIRYSETEKFADFIYLYKNEKEYIDIINKLVDNTLPLIKTSEQIQEFLLKHTWKQRVKDIMSHIEIEECK